jgi:hypothetical protein
VSGLEIAAFGVLALAFAIGLYVLIVDRKQPPEG